MPPTPEDIERQRDDDTIATMEDSVTTITYIVESPIRGVLVDQDFQSWDNTWRSKFSYVTPRNEAKQFTTLQAALTATSRLTNMQAKDINILTRASGKWEVVS